MSSRVFEYKGYVAISKYCAIDDLFYSQISGIADLVSFHAETEEGLEKAFQGAVDDYLTFCKEVGKEPDVPGGGN